MNKNEFLERLNNSLHELPQKERDDVLEYYNEYFADAGEENEQSVIDELGSPENVAKRLSAHYVVKNLKSNGGSQSPKKGLKSLFYVILAIFAAPIALPLAIAVVAVAFSLCVAAFALVLGFGAGAVGAIICGIATIIVGILSITTGVGTMMFFVGGGFLMLGVGSALFVLTIALSRFSINAITKIMGKFLKRNSPKSDEQGGVNI